jgi:hypothetical protein
MEEAEHPVFGCCPFAGVYCKLCKTSITCEGKTSQETNMHKHITSPAHLKNCGDVLATVTLNQQHKDFVASAKMKLLPIAEELVKAWMTQKNVDDARLLLAEFLMQYTDLFHCPICKRYYVGKKNHKHRDMKKEPVYCPKVLCAGGNNRMIATGYDPYNFSILGVYPRLFRDLLEKECTQQQQQTERLPAAKRAKTTPQTRTGLNLTVNPRWSLQPPFQAGNSTAYVGAPPLYAANPPWLLPGNFGWPPWQWQLLEWNGGNLNIEYPSQSMTSIKPSEKTGMPPEPRLPGYSANMPAPNKASEAVRQDENEVIVNGQGDSEEGRPCTQPARSAPTEDDAKLLISFHQAGPDPRESLKPSRTTPFQERQGQSNTGGEGDTTEEPTSIIQSNTGGEGDTTEEPTSVVQTSSPSGASNGYLAILKQEQSEEIEKHEADHADSFADASPKTPPVSHLNPATITVRRKAAKRTEAWYNDLASPPPPPLLRIPARRSRAKSTFPGQIEVQLPFYLESLPLQDKDEDMPATKKPRLEPPILATVTAEAEAPTKTASPDAKRKLLDKLRKGSDLAVTGETNADADADVEDSTMFLQDILGKATFQLLSSVNVKSAAELFDAEKTEGSQLHRAVSDADRARGVSECKRVIDSWCQSLRTELDLFRASLTAVTSPPPPPPPKSAATRPPKGATTPPPKSTKPPPQKKAKIKVDRRYATPRSFEYPFDGLKIVAKRFLATMKITTAEKLLSSRTADIAVNFADWRIKENMPELKGNGASATVSTWKAQVRKLAEEMGLEDLADMKQANKASWRKEARELSRREGKDAEVADAVVEVADADVEVADAVVEVATLFGL